MTIGEYSKNVIPHSTLQSDEITIMRNIFAILIGCILCASLVQAAEDSNNLLGYGKTSWGMTPVDVVKAESPRAEILEKPEEFKAGIGLATIKEIQIGTQKFSVTFIFDALDVHLQQVNLTSAEKKNSGINGLSFSSLEKLLTEKYGSPTFKEESRVISWKLQKTTINLSHLDIPGVISQVTVTYKPTEATDSAARDL